MLVFEAPGRSWKEGGRSEWVVTIPLRDPARQGMARKKTPGRCARDDKVGCLEGPPISLVMPWIKRRAHGANREIGVPTGRHMSKGR